jgi:hypothetical protein
MREEASMIVAIVTFELPQARTVAEMTEVFRSTAPKYLGVPGLMQKTYWVGEDGRRAGGIYFWASRQDAARLYTDEWKRTVEGKYGCLPKIEFLESPVTVDNERGEISAAA